MRSPDNEKNILDLLCQKNKSTQYIHVYPGELKVYSLIYAGIKDKKGKRCLWEVRMMEYTRDILAGFSLKGTPIPVKSVVLSTNGQEEEIKAFLQMVRETGILIDTGTRVVSVDGSNIDLTYKEYELLKLLVSHPGIVYSRQQILEKIWCIDFKMDTRTVDMHIKTLRQKLGEQGSIIQTIRNVGYKAQ